MSEDKYIAIGDIHGCLESFDALWEKLEPYYDRKFIFVGDYIDRGPSSKGVVDRMMELDEQFNCVFIRGNHEQMLLDAVKSGDRSLWMMNGGRTTLVSYGGFGDSGNIPEEHMEFYESTKLYYNTDRYFFVHAGIAPGKTIKQSLEDGDTNDFLWERSHLQAIETPWEKTVVFGHTPQPQPIKKNNMIGIDTGCVFNRNGMGTLTAVKLPEEEFIQQDCLDFY